MQLLFYFVPLTIPFEAIQLYLLYSPADSWLKCMKLKTEIESTESRAKDREREKETTKQSFIQFLFEHIYAFCCRKSVAVLTQYTHTYLRYSLAIVNKLCVRRASIFMILFSFSTKMPLDVSQLHFFYYTYAKTTATNDNDVEKVHESSKKIGNSAIFIRWHCKYVIHSSIQHSVSCLVALGRKKQQHINTHTHSHIWAPTNKMTLYLQDLLVEKWNFR